MAMDFEIPDSFPAPRRSIPRCHIHCISIQGFRSFRCNLRLHILSNADASAIP